MTQRAGREAGFVLIESIAVLALSVLVLLALLIAADLVTRNSAAAARRANDLEALATGYSALRRDIAAARYMRVGGVDSPLLFQGSAAALGIVVEGGVEPGNGDHLVWITTQEAEGRRLLVRSEAPLLPQTGGFAAEAFKNPAVLLSGPWRYSFSYASSAGPSLSWSASWSDLRNLPAAIRLEVTYPNGERVLSPLVAPVHVDAGPDCRTAEGGPCAGAPDAEAQPAEGSDAPASPQ